MQGLCCLDVQGSRALDAVREFVGDSNESLETVVEARRALEAVFEDREACESLMTRHARHWEVGRLAVVDRNILRLAVWELRHERTPVKVVIAEAMRLAREFSTAESAGFVNGVLDAIAKELRGRSVDQPPPADAKQDP